MADRHYSRKRIGAAEFCPPGHNIVLLGANDDALWVSHRPAPNAGLERPRFDGMDYWDNPYFRNESGMLGTDLILEALAITRYFWRDALPVHGFHTFVNPRKVKPIKRHGKPVYGWVFEKSGFELSPTMTGSKLYRWILPLDKLLSIQPLEPMSEQFAMAI